MKPPERNYYGFGDMVVDINNPRVVLCDDRLGAIKARTAAHEMAHRRGWRFRTHLNYDSNIAVALMVWRVA